MKKLTELVISQYYYNGHKYTILSKSMGNTIYQGYRGLPAEFQNGYTQFDAVYCPYNINYYHPDKQYVLNTVWTMSKYLEHLNIMWEEGV